MVLILIGIIAAIVLTAVLCYIEKNDDGWRGTLSGVVGIFLGVISAIMVVGYCFLAYKWQASGVQSQIINREYKTNYTREEVFYASNVIDVIRQLDRRRMEINGDIMRGESKVGIK